MIYEWREMVSVMCRRVVREPKRVFKYRARGIAPSTRPYSSLKLNRGLSGTIFLADLQMHCEQLIALFNVWLDFSE